MIRHIIETDIASSDEIGLVKVDGDTIQITQEGTVYVKPELLEEVKKAKEDILILDEKIDNNISQVNTAIENNITQVNATIEERILQVNTTIEEFSSKTNKEIIDLNSKVKESNEELNTIIERTQEVLTVVIKNTEDLIKEIDFFDERLQENKEEVSLIIKSLSDRIDAFEGITDMEELANKLIDIKNEMSRLTTGFDNISKRIELLETNQDEFIKQAKNVKLFGVKGDGITDDTLAIREVFESAGKIYFPEGEYHIYGAITVYSNTEVVMHPNAMIVRKSNGSMVVTYTTTETTDYNGAKNIRFKGGIFKHNGHTSGGNIFSLFHAEDIMLDDVVCLDNVGAHCIDIVGCNNVKVYNCKFKGYVAVTESPNKESIQIDAAGCNSFPIYTDENAKAYDGTQSCNITIENCLFCKSDDNPPHPTSIGQHGQLKLKHGRYENIKILNNTMIGDPTYTHSYGIRGISWENAVISGNVIENYRTSMYFDMHSNVSDPNGNVIKDITNYPTKNDESTLYLGCKDIVIANNVLKPAITNSTRPSIWFNIEDALANKATTNSPKHRNISISGNVINMVSPTIKSYGVDFDATENVIINGNTFMNNAKADSIAVNTILYCNNIVVGDNVYKNITNENIYSAHLTSSGVKAKGRFKLWSGQASATGTNMVLSNKIDNYDKIMLEIFFLGTNYQIFDFSNTATQSFRELNITDSTTSSDLGFAEMRFKRTANNTIQLTGNKFHALSTGAFKIDDTSMYVTAIYGINY